MPQFVLKTKPEDGEGDPALWVVWSTVVDAITAVGTKDEIRDLLIEDEIKMFEKQLDMRLARAEKIGTSAMGPGEIPTGGWHDTDLIVMEGPGGRGDLGRAKLHEYAKAVMEDREDDAAAMVIPFEEEE
jgi:hypothetical protein